MKFTEQDLARQREEFSRLSEELASLNTRFDAQKKSLGLSDDELSKAPASASAPELAAAMNEARARAERAGREAADALRHSITPSSESASSSPRMRRGAMRI